MKSDDSLDIHVTMSDLPLVNFKHPNVAESLELLENNKREFWDKLSSISGD